MPGCLGDELQTMCQHPHSWRGEARRKSGTKLASDFPFATFSNGLLNRTTPERVWRGLEVPTAQEVIKLLGTPLGHPDFVRFKGRV